MSDDDYAQDTGEPGEEPEVLSAEDEAMFEDDFVDVDIMQASMTAFAGVNCDELSARGSAIASATVAGDAEITGSVIGAMNTESLSLRKSGAVAVVVAGDAALSQSAAQVVVARHVELESSGAGIMVAGDASIARSWVGFMAARNAELSDDSRVIIDTRAGLIIGGLLFGGLGLLAVAVYLGARRISDRMSHFPHMPAMRGRAFPYVHRPSMPDLAKMPEFPQVAEMIAKLRHAG